MKKLLVFLSNNVKIHNNIARSYLGFTPFNSTKALFLTIFTGLHDRTRKLDAFKKYKALLRCPKMAPGLDVLLHTLDLTCNWSLFC